MTMRIRTSAVAVAAAAFALAGVAGAGAASASGAGSATPDAPLQVCRPGTLKASLSEDDGRPGGMNHAGRFLRVENTGKSACTLKGYAGLAMESPGHEAIRTVADQGDTYFAKDPGAHTITLESGADAWADLEWTHTGADSAKAGYLQISPTGSNSHSTVPFDGEVDNGTLSVTAWAAEKPDIG